MKSLTDTEIIRDPNRWGMWPMLPMKRRSNSLDKKDLGFLLDSIEHNQACRGNGVFTIFHHYAFDMKSFDARTCPATTYKTLEAMLQDEWVID